MNYLRFVAVLRIEETYSKRLMLPFILNSILM